MCECVHACVLCVCEFVCLYDYMAGKSVVHIIRQTGAFKEALEAKYGSWKKSWGVCRVRHQSWRIPAVESDHEGPRSELSCCVDLSYRRVREGMVRGIGGRPDVQTERQADSKALEELEIFCLLVLEGKSNIGQ